MDFMNNNKSNNYYNKQNFVNPLALNQISNNQQIYQTVLSNNQRQNLSNIKLQDQIQSPKRDLFELGYNRYDLQSQHLNHKIVPPIKSKQFVRDNLYVKDIVNGEKMGDWYDQKNLSNFKKSILTPIDPSKLQNKKQQNVSILGTRNLIGESSLSRLYSKKDYQIPEKPYSILDNSDIKGSKSQIYKFPQKNYNPMDYSDVYGKHDGNKRLKNPNLYTDMRPEQYLPAQVLAQVHSLVSLKSNSTEDSIYQQNLIDQEQKLIDMYKNAHQKQLQEQIQIKQQKLMNNLYPNQKINLNEQYYNQKKNENQPSLFDNKIDIRNQHIQNNMDQDQIQFQKLKNENFSQMGNLRYNDQKMQTLKSRNNILFHDSLSQGKIQNQTNQNIDAQQYMSPQLLKNNFNTIQNINDGNQIPYFNKMKKLNLDHISDSQELDSIKSSPQQNLPQNKSYVQNTNQIEQFSRNNSILQTIQIPKEKQKNIVFQKYLEKNFDKKRTTFEEIDKKQNIKLKQLDLENYRQILNDSGEIRHVKKENLHNRQVQNQIDNYHKQKEELLQSIHVKSNKLLF